MNIRLILAMLAGVAIMSCGGCAIGGAVLAPTSSEKKRPAEYKLQGTKEKIMVVVEEARSSSAGFNFQAELDDTISAYLVKKVRISNDNIVRYRDFRTSEDVVDVLSLSPGEMGAKAGADLVLYVRIERYELLEMDRRGFYSGTLYTQSVVIDVASDEVVWPRDGKPRLTRIRVDLETSGRDKTTELLARATAHCITRYLYDCPNDKFRSGYEATEFDLNKY
jgi:hypothetical protein